MAVKTSSSSGFILAEKEGYVHYTWDGTIQGVSRRDDGNDAYVIEMEGRTYFNPPFKKKSGLESSKDSLIISLISYEDINKYHQTWSKMIFKGKSPFVLSENSAINPRADGDRYLRYKLEWTNDGVWQSKIDSVYLPISLEVYRDTIFY